jgi:hypothetical protein
VRKSRWSVRSLLAELKTGKCENSRTVDTCNDHENISHTSKRPYRAVLGSRVVSILHNRRERRVTSLWRTCGGQQYSIYCLSEHEATNLLVEEILGEYNDCKDTHQKALFDSSMFSGSMGYRSSHALHENLYQSISSLKKHLLLL